MASACFLAAQLQELGYQLAVASGGLHRAQSEHMTSLNADIQGLRRLAWAHRGLSEAFIGRVHSDD